MIFKDEDFKIEYFSGTGKGGQHRNKTQNCVRCIHISTGITALGTSSRSRINNKNNAMNVCKERVKRFYHKDIERYKAKEEIIRTYHAVENYVINHSSNTKDTFQNIVEKCHIDTMIEDNLKGKYENKD